MHNKIHKSNSSKNNTFLCDKRNCSLKEIFVDHKFNLYENRNHSYHLYMGNLFQNVNKLNFTIFAF